MHLHDFSQHEETLTHTLVTNGYAYVNSLRMYYEIYGSGDPLVLIHGGGSTIQSTFGRIIPVLARSYKLIAVEMQAHGRTADIDLPLSFERDADDVAALVQQLGISKAHFLGFSNGGTTCLQIAIRHRKIVDKLILCSAIHNRSGMERGFFDHMEKTNIGQMPGPLKTAYFETGGNEEGLRRMFERDVARMIGFEDIPTELLRNIDAPAFVINSDREVVRAEHAMELAKILRNAQLAILPGGHGEYIGEICSVDPHSRLPFLVCELILEFLQRS